MNENLSYLFLTGIILGSGPCLSFCAPFLIIYTAAQKKGFKQSLLSYGIFSLGKLISYVLWGLVCALGAIYLQSEMIAQYTKSIYFVLGSFIIALGAVTCFGVKGFFGNTCAIVNKGHVRNVGLAGLLVGLSPCLPLLGMLNYVVLVSKSPFEAMMYIFVFGLGTVCSPLVLLIALSGKFAQVLSQNQKVKIFLQYACGAILMFLGARIMILGVR